MASAPKKVRTLTTRTTVAATVSVVPGTLDPATVNAAVLQLQATVNEVISRFNSHTHSAGAVAAPDAATRVQGVAVAATNLFTDN